MAKLEGAPLRLLRRFSVGSDRVGSRSLDNEQFVETVIHYCRHRRNAAPGNQRYLFENTPRSGQQAALGHDLLEFLDALGIERAILGG